jgi:xanthine dehydrogenase accessory factor
VTVEIYEEIVRLKKDGRPSALATIVQCTGSSPQKEGAKMLVRDDGSILGTMGGGCLEAEVIQASVMAIRDGSPRTLPIELTEKHGGLVCGGKVLVYIEPIITEPRLIIMGAGHVGKALARVAKFSGFKTAVVDDREEFANKENIPDADELVVHDLADAFSKVFVDGGSYIVIATRGHNHDLDALKSALRTGAGYIGLLGSKRKRALLFKILCEEGFSKEDVGRVITPVGLSIGSVTPEEIAISIMAQIIQKRREHIVPGIGSASCSRLGKQDGEAQAASPPR